MSKNRWGGGQSEVWRFEKYEVLETLGKSERCRSRRFEGRGDGNSEGWRFGKKKERANLTRVKTMGIEWERQKQGEAA